MHQANARFYRLLLLGALLTLFGYATSMGGDSLRPPSTALKVSKGKEQASRGMDGAAKMAQVEVSYSLDQRQFTLHEPINLKLKIENRLEQPIQFDLGQDRKTNFILTVKKLDGTSVRLQQPIREGTSRPGSVLLQPGQTYTQKLLLNEWYEFPEPGEYEFAVSIDSKIQTLEGLSVCDIAEYHAMLEIKPRDAARLERICACLLERISNHQSYRNSAEVWIEAAHTLSYIKDPAAVPYIEKAIALTQMVDPTLFAGLERIGGEKAIQALNTLSKNRNREIASTARGYLGRIKWRAEHNRPPQ